VENKSMVENGWKMHETWLENRWVECSSFAKIIWSVIIEAYQHVFPTKVLMNPFFFNDLFMNNTHALFQT
jgi:hypothetical protein